MVPGLRPRVAVVTAVVAILGLCWTAPPAEAKPGYELASRGLSGEKANAGALDPSTSRDGRYVAFESTATNLHPDDPDPVLDVFVRDLETDTTILVSRASGATGAKGDAASADPSISADGRFVAFTSIADNLGPALTPSTDTAQIYVRDLAARTTTLASRASGPLGAPGDHYSRDPVISADGSSVAFQSAANIDPDDEFWTDIYVRDLAAETTVLASRASGAAGAKGDDESYYPSISGDGSLVAYSSYATNIHPDAAAPNLAAYVRDLTTHETALESRSSGRPGEPGDEDSVAPEISADGSRLAFQSSSGNLVPGPEGPFKDIYTLDLDSHKTKILSRDLPVGRGLERSIAGALTTSASGRRLAFAYEFETRPRPPDRELAFVADLRRDTVKRLPGLVGQVRRSADKFELSISGNGRWLAVRTQKQLHRADEDKEADVYITRLKH